MSLLAAEKAVYASRTDLQKTVDGTENRKF